MNSLELTGPFHTARRIAKMVAPDFRVFATSALSEGEVVLDLKSKTIEISEHTEQQKAIAAVLFQLGHIRLRSHSDLSEHFGNVLDINEKRLINKLVRQGLQADGLAAKWASDILCLIFDTTPEQANALVDQFVWTEEEWKSYYLS